MPRSPGPEKRPSVPPGGSGGSDDRTTERRLIPATASHSIPPHSTLASESTRDVAQEDFLFHLYRGSELLQENRVLEAKEELEFALTMQPQDPKGQDLLGAVYFRLGHYPRAIQIYEALEQGFPNDASIKVNLALSYLKTGQPEAARRTLQDATRINPEHTRAWGYLGLALQKLGELEQAQIAFERGGHPMMARRVTERRQRVTMPAPAGGGAGIDEGVRSAAETAFSELDAGELRFALAEQAAPRSGDSPWHTTEPGDVAKAATGQARTKPPPPPVMTMHYPSPHEVVTVPPAPPVVSPAAVSTRLVPPPPDVPAPLSLPSPAGERHVAPSLFAHATEAPVTLHARGVLLVRTTEENAFAAKLESLRIVAGTAATRVLHRRLRDADTHDVLGGIGTPIVRVAGDAKLVLGARPGHAIVPVALQDELAFIREEALLGFELRLAYENGRLALDAPGEGGRAAGEGAHLVQLRGTGAVVLELAGELASVPSTPGQPLLVRREWIVGWLGRLVPRASPPAESPSGQRGLIAFSGEGTVLVCAG
ncbi:MAG TPA: tetratricopeptide repeat protein [Polyangiaceae bacterium]